MKKLMVTVVAALAAFVSVASTDVYEFKGNAYFPFLQKNSTINGYMTIVDSTNATLEVYVKKLDKTFVMKADNTNSVQIAYGKKDANSAVEFAFADEDGTFGFTVAGHGKNKTVKSGCGPCGDVTICTKVNSISGHLVGWYECGCGIYQFSEYLDECTIGPKSTNLGPIHGTWNMKLKTVDGFKFK